MSIPQAVSPGTVTPGLFLSVDLLAGAASPNSGTLRVALMAAKASTGNLTNDTEVRAGGGEASAGTAFGIGASGHLAAKQLYAKYPLAQVDFISPVPGAGQATIGITFAGAPTSNTSVLVNIAGRTFELAWLVGETANNMRDKLIAAISQRTQNLPVVAVSGGAGVVTINAKTTGRVGNDVKVKAVLSLAQTGTEAVTGAATLTNLSGGSADPDFTNAIAAIQGQEYAFIVPVLSNTDATNTGTKSNVGKLVDYITANNTGLNAKLQQLIVGVTTTISAAKAAALSSNGGENSVIGEMLTCINGLGLPGELAARECGGWLAGLAIDPAINRIGELLDGYIGSADKITDRPTTAQSEDALGNGVALVSYTAQGLEMLVRPVCMHSQDSAGGSDHRLLDCQMVSATYIVARDLRSALPAEFPNAKITKDIAPGDSPPPKGVTEERDIKAFVIERLRFWQDEGVILKESLDASIADGTLIVQVNSSDASQVDIVLPFKIVPPLAKFGVVVQRQPN